MIRSASIVLCLLIVACACHGATSMSISNLYTILENEQIPFDTNCVQRSAFEGALRSIDPEGRLLSLDEPLPTNSLAAVLASEEWEEGICYVRLGDLTVGSSNVVLGALGKLATPDCFGLILDVRGGGGECLPCVDAIAEVLEQQATDIYTVQSGVGDVLETHSVSGGGGFWSGRPLMLLIDGNTTGACELLACVLKERGRVMLIGTETRGDCAIRETIPVDNLYAIRLATRWIVSSRSHGPREAYRGLVPDVEIVTDAAGAFAVLDEDDVERKMSDKAKHDFELMVRVGGDAVLARATDILLGLKALDDEGTETATRAADGSADEE